MKRTIVILILLFCFVGCSKTPRFREYSFIKSKDDARPGWVIRVSANESRVSYLVLFKDFTDPGWLDQNELDPMPVNPREFYHD